MKPSLQDTQPSFGIFSPSRPLSISLIYNIWQLDAFINTYKLNENSVVCYQPIIDNRLIPSLKTSSIQVLRHQLIFSNKRIAAVKALQRLIRLLRHKHFKVDSIITILKTIVLMFSNDRELRRSSRPLINTAYQAFSAKRHRLCMHGPEAQSNAQIFHNFARPAPGG